MIDLVFLGFIGCVLMLGIRRPFIWVLLYLYVDIVAPQQIGYGIIQSVQVSLIAFAAAFGGWLMIDNKAPARFTYRQGLMAALLLYCWWTTQSADFLDSALTKWDWVWKALLFAIFLPLTLTTKLRIESAVIVLLLSVSSIVIGASIKTVLGGGGYENQLFLVSSNSGLYESSVLACVAIAVIPMIIWAMKNSTIFPPDWRSKTFAIALIFACLLIPVGTEARTGLVCIAVLGAIMFRHVKQKALFAAGGLVLGLISLPFLPSSFYDRMSTITNYQSDESASTRVAVWTWTMDYVAANPMGGGFDAFRGNSFTYTLPVEEENGNTSVVSYQEVTDEGRAYHSAYFEVLGEQGYIGFIIWSLLQISGLLHMRRIIRKWRDTEDDEHKWKAPLAAALMKAQIIYLVGALFTGIAYQPFMLVLLAIQIGLTSLLNREAQGEDAPKRGQGSSRRAGKPLGASRGKRAKPAAGWPQPNAPQLNTDQP